jgi:hypothetical protein
VLAFGASVQRYMLAMLLASLFVALLFVYLYIPSVWMSIMAVDDSLDAHESGLALVASSKPRHFVAIACSPERHSFIHFFAQVLLSVKVVHQRVWQN